jgi:hypothetical protein
MAKNQVSTKVGTASSNEIKHVEYLDVDDSGQLKEVAVVKRWDDGSVSYINIKLLDNVDKGRLKGILEGVHADKYELFELLSQARLTNGLNALDYFHPLVRIKRAKGHIDTVQGGGLNSVKSVKSDGSVIGQEFSDPTSGEAAGTANSY